ncbi:MAG: hypothetical protein KDD19_29435 [Phaeodactylibacter sp.]|nr:hypothetical protein [Phaeodactylibacter sp.]MCB9048674.1 hypothetical protein [Lewinellaceae bacterium]
MRNILILAALLSTQSTPAQERFISSEFSDFYDWFHQRSQVAQLYEDQSELFTFTNNTEVHAGPCQSSEVTAQLPIGYAVRNIAYNDDYYLPEDEIDGYGDIWYHVRGKDLQGKAFTGYIWGAQIARGWQSMDLTGDGEAEFIMLGISSKARKVPTDINAELRIVRRGQLVHQKTVPGLCVFEDCAASPLLRAFETPQGFTIIEASTMTVGCWAGIEKSFFYWDGVNLQRVYHAEYTTHKEFANESFVFPGKTNAQLCHYSHEDENYSPVWKCQEIAAGNSRASVAMERTGLSATR